MTNIGGLYIVPQYYPKVEYIPENTLIFLMCFFACMICKESLTLMHTYLILHKTTDLFMCIKEILNASRFVLCFQVQM